MSRTKTMLVAAVAVVLLAACGGGDDDSASFTSDDAPADASGSLAGGGVSGDVAAGGEGAGTGVTDVGNIDLASAVVDRKIVYRGDIASDVDDVVTAVRAARDEAASAGGFVFAQDVTDGAARVVLKVPSVGFDAAFDAVVAIGDVQSQSIEADDVTETFTDLDSRRATLESSITRLRGFLDAAANADEVSRLESELTRREAERDVIAGQLRVLRDQTSFGTISVQFTEPVDDDEGDDEDESAGGLPGFGGGLDAGWDVAVAVGASVATLAGFLVPFVPVLLSAGGAGIWWQRRRVSVLADRPS